METIILCVAALLTFLGGCVAGSILEHSRYIPRKLCSWGFHDWRYASTHRVLGYESRARCERCEVRKWTKVGK